MEPIEAEDPASGMVSKSNAQISQLQQLKTETS